MRIMRRCDHLCWSFLIGLAVAFLAATATSFAQVKSSTINIVVTDSTGARVPDVAAEVVEQSTNLPFKGRTNNFGELSVPYLPAGRYTISLQKAGFRPYSQTGLELGSNQTAAVSAVLSIGENQQVVEVSASAVHLQTESSSIQGATSEMTIDALPNLNSNPMYYATLQAGVVPANPSFYDTTSHNAFGIGYYSRLVFSSVSVNGGEPQNMDIQLDGVPILGTGYNDATVLPNPEGIQEVRVLLNNYTAENGRGQGVTSIITKSGTNELHGSANFRLRNEDFDANTFNNNFYGIPRQPFKSDAYGAGVGGAIKKDKLFFFASYEGLKHSVGEFWQMTVPTAEEKVGNFSHTLIGDQNGNPISAAVFDPYTVTQLGTNLYQRATVPGAIIPNPTGYGLKLMGDYPAANRPASDVYGDNNFYYSGKQAFSKNSVNGRVDYRLGQKHSIYASGGILAGTISSPSPYGADNPFYNYSNNWTSQFDKDRNPYASIGDTIVINSTTVMDVRYGITRVSSLSQSGDVKVNYSDFGIPASIQAIMPSHTQAPDFCAGSRFSCLGMTDWGHKYTHQTTHNTTGSVTKSLGHWTLKAGAEYRVSLSNYEDFAEGSVSIDPLGDNMQYVTASGGGVVQNSTPVQGGYSAANIFMGAASFHLTPGFDVRPAFAAKYGAVYSQNDWRVNSKLTLNLGLRYEIQPAPTERYGRFSSFDANATSPFGSGMGAISFPGQNTPLWSTHHADIGPRMGFAYSLTPNTVVRGGYGIVYNPTNTGYAPGPSRYGEEPFTPAVVNNMYGTNPHGVPAGTMDSGLTAQIIMPVGINPTAPQLYGTSSGFPLFNRYNYQDGRIQQFNLVVERKFGSNWFVSLAYAGNKSSHLPNFEALSDPQYIPSSTLSNWRSSYIASNGTDPGQLQVQNPFQPATGDLLPFSGSLGNRTISQELALSGNPLLTTLAASSSIGSAYYNSVQFHVNHAFASGFLLDAHYTWSKSMANGAGDMNANASTFLQDPDLKNINNDWHYGFFDVPQRFVGTFVYSLPFGKGQRYEVKNAVARYIASGWRIGGVEDLQSGFPVPITVNGGTGSLNHLPNRVAGVAVQLPKSFQHFYDGKTAVTLPSGRVITPCDGCYLKFNPDAFAMGMATLANGTQVADPYWYGTSALTYNDVRGPGRLNTDLNLSRTFHITEKKVLDFIANVTNAWNHTELMPASNLNVGSANTSNYPGTVSNLALSGNQGTSTYEPRQIELKLRLQF
ncbi:MAG: TonB-dependent receptor [Bryobacteraceae bacterium]|nr:TonB-dependent receptor [Bryobacteraceae bacterium]